MNNLRKQLNILLDEFEKDLKDNSNIDLESIKRKKLNYFKFIMIKAILKSKSFKEFKVSTKQYNRIQRIIYKKGSITKKENNLRKLLNAVGDM